MFLKRLFLFSACSVFSLSCAYAQEWQTIPVEKSLQVTLSDGSSKTIQPACALDALPAPADAPEGTPAFIPNDFRFYFKQGESDNVLVYFQGGGACWNDATCVDSLALQHDGNPQSRPAYNPSVYTENNPVEAGGIFNDEREDNPFKDWSKVFIPYCSGDLHAGSGEVEYTDNTGVLTGMPGGTVTIKHHGHDNVLAVREWLKSRYASETPENVLIAGSSAGGYGATLNFPYIQSVFPNVQASLLSDSAMAVMTRGFVNDVLVPGGNWNLENTLPAPFDRKLGAYRFYKLNNQLMGSLAYAYPYNRFAQYTTGLDAVQVQFLKIADQIDRGNLNPADWALAPSEFLYFLTWHVRMGASAHTLSAFTWNYQYYIGEGTCHMVLTDFCEQNALPVSQPSPFFNENSAQGVAFKNWLHAFATDVRFRENSVSYTN